KHKIIPRLIRECPREQPRNPRMAKHPHFDREIDRLLEVDSTERPGIFDKIKSHIATNDRGYILVEGGPGSGKSWIMAKATRHFGKDENLRCAWHFNRIHDKNRSVSLVRTLFEQLSTIYDDLRQFDPEYRRVCAEDRDHGGFLLDVLDFLDRSGQLKIPL